MQPRSKLNRALAITLVAGLGLLVLLGLVFSIARGSQQITSNATALHSADETLRTATVVRAQVGIATHLITIDDHFGTSSEEAIALSVSEARTSLADMSAGIRHLEDEDLVEGTGVENHARRFRESSESLIFAITGRDFETVHELYEEYDSRFQELRMELELVRDHLAASVNESDDFLGRIGDIARFLVAFLIPAAVIYIYRELLLRQQKHSELEGRLESERRLSKAREEFIANASHELRTPLTGIAGLAQILAEDPVIQGSDSSSELIELIISESRDLARMVEDLLTTARLDAGALHLDFEDFFIDTAVREVVDPMIRAGTDIKVACNPGLVLADGLRTRQILRNLLSNASKYGGGYIEVDGRVEGRTYALEVRDDGPGIPDEMVDRVFQRFVHRDNPGLTDSVGLGLAIVRALAQAMGGNVVYTRRDGMTVFTVRLPLAEDPVTGQPYVSKTTIAEPAVALES
jgi:signal transduction histidine kinase